MMVAAAVAAAIVIVADEEENCISNVCPEMMILAPKVPCA
jgi:hypothetical protein